MVVEARYQKVEIEKDGTVHLTLIPGKVKTIKPVSYTHLDVYKRQHTAYINYKYFIFTKSL